MLVHGYVDDARVVGFLDRLDDLRRYVLAGVAGWADAIAAAGEGPAGG